MDDTTAQWKLRMAALRRVCGLPVRARGEQGKQEEEEAGGDLTSRTSRENEAEGQPAGGNRAALDLLKNSRRVSSSWCSSGTQGCAAAIFSIHPSVMEGKRRGRSHLQDQEGELDSRWSAGGSRAALDELTLSFIFLFFSRCYPKLLCCHLLYSPTHPSIMEGRRRGGGERGGARGISAGFDGSPWPPRNSCSSFDVGGYDLRLPLICFLDFLEVKGQWK